MLLGEGGLYRGVSRSFFVCTGEVGQLFHKYQDTHFQWLPHIYAMAVISMKIVNDGGC